MRRVQPDLSPAPSELSPAPRPTPLLILEELRPRQWTKNLVVLAPLLFARSVFQGDSATKALVAFASFCLLASAIYQLNDWLDREKDRLHPEKKNRPIAAGLLGGRTVFASTALCLLIGVGLAIWVGPAFARVGLSYVGMQILYSAVLKRMVILDVVVIAMGFVLRVLGGGVAIGVPVSNWLYLCTLLLAIFLGFAKRRHELSLLYEQATAHRANLSDYSLPMLDQMISVVAASCILAYALYTVAPRTVEHVGSDRLKFTVPFVIYGIFRYLFLIHKRGAGGSPERVLLSDPATLVDIVLFLAVASWALYW